MIERAFTVAATRMSAWAGASLTFILAPAVPIWVLTGRFDHYGDVWQLGIKTGAAIVTALMVFLVQHVQNRDAARAEARGQFIALEHRTCAKLQQIRTALEEACADEDRRSSKPRSGSEPERRLRRR